MGRFKRFLRKTRLKQHVSGLTRVEKNAQGRPARKLFGITILPERRPWPTVAEESYLLRRQAEMELHRLESEGRDG